VAIPALGGEVLPVEVFTGDLQAEDVFEAHLLVGPRLLGVTRGALWTVLGGMLDLVTGFARGFQASEPG